MSETKDTDRKPLSLARPAGGKLELKKGSEPGAGQVRQSFPMAAPRPCRSRCARSA